VHVTFLSLFLEMVRPVVRALATETFTNYIRYCEYQSLLMDIIEFMYFVELVSFTYMSVFIRGDLTRSKVILTRYVGTGHGTPNILFISC
jgi:hypothetical protein